ncbi:hypothetical protein [Pseudokineococcus marinus]|uniref:Uncharacterized protein n=1 Tax=Pseudokineococcus marinus TaxID=351215 RepID=A0A849BKU8_9ACTN|nr:hypothetical protein [Pseudokineococcus marinus]NNH21717.1 hypothetical protein [Pseudokineococcus marinus]
MDEVPWPFVIAGGLMLLIAPHSLMQASNRFRRAEREGVRGAMTSGYRPEDGFRWPLALLGLVLAAGWTTVWVVVGTR